MKAIKLLLSSMILFTLNGCYSKLTVSEFKQKYDWDEAICTVRGYYLSKMPDFVFEYNGEECIITTAGLFYGFDFHDIGDQYYVLFDKKKPKDNYLVQYDRRIKPDKENFMTLGKVKFISTKRKDYIAVLYEWYGLKGKGEKKAEKYEYSEAYPYKYYNKFKYLLDTKKNIYVDQYIIEEHYENGVRKGKTLPFINLEKTFEGLDTIPDAILQSK